MNETKQNHAKNHIGKWPGPEWKFFENNINFRFIYINNNKYK